MIRIYTTGRHAHRSPLSYPALRPLFAPETVHVAHPSEADLYVFAHISDLHHAPRAVVEDWRARRRPVLLLSEEPFWDTIWGKQPLAHHIHVETPFGTLPVAQLNHHTSDIFRCERIPYYLLTDHRFVIAYGHRFARNAARSVEDWQQHFATCPAKVSFMFERRSETYHSVRWPEGDIIGLSAWRTALAKACRFEQVERYGHSWGKDTNRLALATDWHMDKLVRMDAHTRALGALENTHQPNYVTEKFFDAFACGAQPIYYASPQHRIHDLGLPDASWINLFDTTPEDAAEHLRKTRPDPEAFAVAQSVLHGLFTNNGLWLRERTRLQSAIIRALHTALG